MKPKVLFTKETTEFICNALGIEILTTENGTKCINQNGIIIFLDDIIGFHKDIGAITDIRTLVVPEKEIKVGTMMVAIDPCTMSPSRKDALIVGKEYMVHYVNNHSFCICSEIDDTHIFFLDSCKGFLRIK